MENMATDPLIFQASGLHPHFLWIWSIMAIVNTLTKSNFASPTTVAAACCRGLQMKAFVTLCKGGNYVQTGLANCDDRHGSRRGLAVTMDHCSEASIAACGLRQDPTLCGFSGDFEAFADQRFLDLRGLAPGGRVSVI